MLRAGPAHVLNRRTARTTRLEALRDELLQGQHELLDEMRQSRQAITERLDRMAARLEEKHGGGHPLRYDWRSVELAIYGEANLNRFDTYAELRKFTNDFVAQWPRQPTDRAIQDFLRPLAEAMNLPRK